MSNEQKPTDKSIYEQLKAMNVTIQNRYSDLYVPCSVEVKKALIENGCDYQMFKSNIDGQMWYEVPFAFDPYWEKVLQ